MKEEFLHYVWLHKKLSFDKLVTVKDKSIEIVQSGLPNFNAGPDFFNAQIVIDGQFWAGNLEIHCKSSDWYAHHHETDSAYDNVILHVVWEHDVEVFRSDQTNIPVLELREFVNPKLWDQYQNLIQSNARWIPCETQFKETSSFLTQFFLERLFVERLEAKTKLFRELLRLSNNDWEAMLFQTLVKGFGLNVNGDSFLKAAHSLPFSLIRKTRGKPLVLESLLLGQLRLLEDEKEDGYYSKIKEIYLRYKHNYLLDQTGIPKPHFFRLRPSNFPTIRLSQVASLYENTSSIFMQITSAQTIKDLYGILKTKTSEYWETHYTFGKSSKKRNKFTSQGFIDLLIINAILPLRFCYDQHLGNENSSLLFSIARAMSPENNSIVKKYSTMGIEASDALESQSLIQLKKNYCNAKQCLKCSIGNSLLST